MSVHEAEQIENARNFMKRYGAGIFGGIVIALIGYGGWTYWKNSQEADAQVRTAQVQELMTNLEQSDQTTALSGFEGTADKLTEEAPNSVQAVQAQFAIAEQAYKREDYAAAEKALSKIINTQVKDKGLIALVHIRLANAQYAQEKFDDALATLAKVNEPMFIPSIEERKGDIFVAKQDIESAQKAYKAAWDSLVQRNEDSQILRMKLGSLGVVVDEPNIERPIILPTSAPATNATTEKTS